MDGCSKGYFSRVHSRENVQSWFYMCPENKLYDKGGDTWTGREGLAKELNMSGASEGNNVEMEGERGIFGELDKCATMGGKVALWNGMSAILCH